MKQQIHEITVCGIEDKLLESLWSHITKNGKPDIEDDGDCESGPDFSYNGHQLGPFHAYATETAFKTVLHEDRNELFVKKSQFMLGLKEARECQALWY